MPNFIVWTVVRVVVTAECVYSHDVSGELFDDLQDDSWHCPRDSLEDAAQCRFHADPELVDSDVTSRRLRESIQTESGPVRLLGAKLGSVSLDYHTLAGPSNHPIDLREATLEGDISLKNATVERPLRFENATFEGAVDFGDTRLSRRVDFGGASFETRVSFRMAEFESWFDLRDVDFHGPVYARVARFGRGIYGVDVTFHAAADFMNTRFDDVANFYRSTFERGAVFNSTTFDGNAQFIEATFDTPTVELASETGSDRFRGRQRDGVTLSMNGVTCNRNLRLTDAEVAGDVLFTNSELVRDIEADGLTTTGDPVVVDCSGSGVVSGHVDTDGEAVTYDMTEATLGEFDVEEIGSFDAFHFDDTSFEGFDFGSYVGELSAAQWQLHDSDDESEPGRIENLYLRAKNGANEIGATRPAAEFFVQEMTYRRAGHWRRVVSGDSLGVRSTGFGRWLSNVALLATCGYGERPFRPVVFSVVSIVLFGGIFGILDPSLAYPKPLGYLIFSALIFVSIILGLPEVSGATVNFFIAVEGFVGAFVIALFVFTLTRSISR